MDAMLQSRSPAPQAAEPGQPAQATAQPSLEAAGLYKTFLSGNVTVTGSAPSVIRSETALYNGVHLTFNQPADDSMRLFTVEDATGNADPDLTVSAIHEGDVYLLCSDGLTEMLPDADIAEVLGALGANPRLAAEHLVDLANDRGGVDNISVVIVSSSTGGRLGAELG